MKTEKIIVHILNSASYSGAENVVISLISQLKKQDLNIKCVYVSLDGDIRQIVEKNGIIFEGVSKICVKEIKRIIKKYKPDIIHAHDFTASIISAFSTIRIPIISHIHNNPLWIKKRGKYSIIYGLTCFRYKKILGVSPAFFEEYIFGKYLKKKAIVVGNPISIEQIRNKAEIAIDKEAFDVVFLGRLTEQKNPLLFVEVIKTLSEKKDVRAVMIGGDRELGTQTRKKVEEEGLSNTIYLKGFLENPYGILKNSKLLCLPSIWEGFGLVVVEALALGVPVVASRVGGVPTIIKGKEGRLCDEKQQFIDSLYELLNNEEIYKEAVNSALQRADELDNITEYSNFIRELYLSY